MKEGEEAIVESEKRKRQEESLYAEEVARKAKEARTRENLHIAEGGKTSTSHARQSGAEFAAYRKAVATARKSNVSIHNQSAIYIYIYIYIAKMSK
jgi:hypothetical protein